MWELLKYLRNFFPLLSLAREGNFEIIGGKLTDADDFIRSGQWYLVEGSLWNDGVYRHDSEISETLTDETFTGRVTPLRIPREVQLLADDIDVWQTANSAQLLSPYHSESFGGYSYTRATDADGNAVGWQDVFASRLKVWRKL